MLSKLIALFRCECVHVNMHGFVYHIYTYVCICVCCRYECICQKIVLPVATCCIVKTQASLDTCHREKKETTKWWRQQQATTSATSISSCDDDVVSDVDADAVADIGDAC